MVKWEYLIIINNEFIVDSDLNHYGCQGWELISFQNGKIYFKRKISDES